MITPNHITLFVSQIQAQYDKDFTCTCSNWLRPVGMLIVWRFTGISLAAVATYFSINKKSISGTLIDQRGYEEKGDHKFIRHYNELLDLYIKCCRTYIKHGNGITNLNSNTYPNDTTRNS